MKTDEYKIREVAGSPVITVPRKLLRLLSLKVGDKVTYRTTGSAFVVEAAQRTKGTKGEGK